MNYGVGKVVFVSGTMKSRHKSKELAVVKEVESYSL